MLGLKAGKGCFPDIKHIIVRYYYNLISLLNILNSYLSYNLTFENLLKREHCALQQTHHHWIVLSKQLM